MTQRFEQFPLHNESPYSLQSPSEPITIYTGHMQLRQGNNLYISDRASLDIKWLPSPKLGFSMHQMDDVPELERGQISLDSNPAKYDVQVTSAPISNVGFACSGVVSGIPDDVHLGEVEYVLFQIPNFHKYIGSHLRSPDALSSWLGRIDLSNGSFKLTIDQRQHVTIMFDSLKSEGGFDLTHTGRLEKTKGNISFKEFSTVRLALFYFMSFARGIWTGPIPCVGYRSGAMEWKHLEVPRLTSWKSVSTWFPYNEPNTISDLAQPFWKLKLTLEDQLWGNPIRVAINWYIEANLGAGAVEGSIVLAQTGLELLAWCYLVEDPKTSIESARKFNKWSASRKIRMFLEEIGIPISIPSELSTLHMGYSGIDPSDGSSTITSVRNAIVHPKQSKRHQVETIPKRARFDVKQLALWYLELALLRLINYDGIYYRRFISGYPSDTIARTPWSM